MKTRLRLIFAAAMVLLSFGTGASADDARQTVWLISTRNAPRCGELQDAIQKISCRQMKDCSWIQSNEVEFQKPFDGPTIVFIPGNRTDADEAVKIGCFLHSRIQCTAEGKAFRFVIWDWPADQLCRRNRSDAQLKVTYSRADSYYLATWLDRLPPGEKVCLVGHSLGARIIANAMHLLAGGEVGGRTMSQQTLEKWKGEKRNRVNAVLFAAAIDADWLTCSGQCKALSLFEKVLVTKNGCDWALKWYPWLWGRGGPQAMGFVGPCCVCTDKIEVIDVSCTVGKSHDCMVYCAAPNVCSQWARFAFFAE